MTELMNQRLTIERPTVASKYSEYTYVAMYINCRLEMEEKQIRNVAGDTIISSGTIYTPTKLITGDRTTIDAISYRVEKVDTIKDITGTIMHYQAYLI